MKCKLFSGNSSLFGSIALVVRLCLGVLNGCAHLALSFETISTIRPAPERSPERSELKPNASLITPHRNALQSRFLRAQRQRPRFELRCCSIISIMLNNVATSNYCISSIDHIYTDQQQQQPQENAKKSPSIGLFQHPTHRKNVTFGWRYVACMLYITQHLSISHMPISPLCVDYRPIKSSLSFFCHAVSY